MTEVQSEAPVSSPGQAQVGSRQRSASVRTDAVHIGIDLGTTACRAVAINNNGDIIAQSQALIPAPLRNNEQVTHDPTQWWKAVKASLRVLLAKIEHDRVQALAVDGTSGSLLLCDQKGYPVTPALMYHDGRAVDQAQAISEFSGRHCGAGGSQ